VIDTGRFGFWVKGSNVHAGPGGQFQAQHGLVGFLPLDQRVVFQRFVYRPDRLVGLLHAKVLEGATGMESPWGARGEPWGWRRRTISREIIRPHGSDLLPINDYLTMSYVIDLVDRA